MPKSILLRVTPDGITVQGLRPFPGSHSRSSSSSSSSSSGGGGGSSSSSGSSCNESKNNNNFIVECYSHRCFFQLTDLSCLPIFAL